MAPSRRLAPPANDNLHPSAGRHRLAILAVAVLAVLALLVVYSQTP